MSKQKNDEKFKLVEKLINDDGLQIGAALKKAKMNGSAYYQRKNPATKLKKKKRREVVAATNPLAVFRTDKSDVTLRVSGSPSQLAEFMKAMGGHHAH